MEYIDFDNPRFVLAFAVLLGGTFTIAIIVLIEKYKSRSEPKVSTRKRAHSRTRSTKEDTYEISVKDARTVESALEEASSMLFGEVLSDGDDLEEATEHLHTLFDNAFVILKQLHTN